MILVFIWLVDGLSLLFGLEDLIAFGFFNVLEVGAVSFISFRDGEMGREGVLVF